MESFEPAWPRYKKIMREWSRSFAETLINLLSNKYNSILVRGTQKAQYLDQEAGEGLAALRFKFQKFLNLKRSKPEIPSLWSKM